MARTNRHRDGDVLQRGRRAAIVAQRPMWPTEPAMPDHHDDEDARIGRYLERLHAFESGQQALDQDELRAIASELGVSEAALDRAAAAAIEHRVHGARALQRDEWDAAVDHLRHAVELAPADHEAFRLLGDALRERWHRGGGEDDQLGARRAYTRAQALHWSPEVDRLAAELDGPRRALPNKQRPERVARPTKARTGPVRGPNVALAAILGGLGVIVLLVVASMILRGGNPQDAVDAPPAPVAERAPETPAPAAPPAVPGGSKVPIGGLGTHVDRRLPLEFVVGEETGLQLDAGEVRFQVYGGVAATIGLTAWVRWQGDDALTGLAMTLELLAEDGRVLAAETETVVHDYSPPAWPGDVLPVRIAPSSVRAEGGYAKARLRVASAVHGEIGPNKGGANKGGADKGGEMPLRWVVPTPEGVQLEVAVRAEERDQFGSGKYVTRTYGGTFVVENRGNRGITDLQIAARFTDAKGRAVHQSDNDMVVPTFLPPLRPGDKRRFKIYESGLPAYKNVELLVQVLELAKPTPKD